MTSGEVLTVGLAVVNSLEGIRLLLGLTLDPDAIELKGQLYESCLVCLQTTQIRFGQLAAL